MCIRKQKRSHTHVKEPVRSPCQSSVDYENTKNNPVCTKTNKSVIKESSYNAEVEHNTSEEEEVCDN